MKASAGILNVPEHAVRANNACRAVAPQSPARSERDELKHLDREFFPGRALRSSTVSQGWGPGRMRPPAEPVPSSEDGQI